MNPILLAVLIVTVIGLIGAVILVAASIFMYVPVDERVEQITGCLPGANCGACGCAGCADYAKTIVEDGNAVNKCVPGGAKVAGEIAAIMGVEAGASVPMKAVVACSGTCGKTGKRFEFEGLHSCQAVKGLYGGDGDCKFGCLGYGDCVSVCAFDAIHVVDGVALVDREKCTGCGACAKACPNAIISIIPEHKRKPVVLCQNKDKGAQTRKACSAGCIGCMKCAKACPKQAITVENNLAYRPGEVRGLRPVRQGVPGGRDPRPRGLRAAGHVPRPGGGPRGQRLIVCEEKRETGLPSLFFCSKGGDLPRIGPGPLQKGPPGPHSEGDVAAADGEQGQTRRELELLHQPLREGQLPLWRDGEPAVGPPLIGQ